MRENVVTRGVFSWGRRAFITKPFGIGGRDQAKRTVEKLNQVIEFAGSCRQAGSLEKLVAGPHVSLNIGARTGQQGAQHRARRFLPRAVASGRRGRAEGFLQECHANTVDTT